MRSPALRTRHQLISRLQSRGKKGEQARCEGGATSGLLWHWRWSGLAWGARSQGGPAPPMALPEPSTQLWVGTHHPGLQQRRTLQHTCLAKESPWEECHTWFWKFARKGTGDLSGAIDMFCMLFGLRATHRIVLQHFIVCNSHFNKNDIFGHPGSWKLSTYESTSKFFKLFNNNSALAGVAQWTECWPVNQRVTGSIPSQGTCLDFRPGPR